MNFSFYIAKRYIFSKSSNNAITIISRIAAGGIIVGAMSLFVVLSVFSGLREFSLSFSNNTDPDFKVNATLGKSFFISKNQEKKINNIKEIESYCKVVEERVLFSFNEKQHISLLKGVDKNFNKVSNSYQNLFAGKWLSSDTNHVVVGYGVAQKLSLGLYDFNNVFEVMAPKPGKGNLSLNPEDSFNKMVLLPVGIFATNDEELDSKYVFSDIGIAQQILQYKSNQVSAIEIKTKLNCDEDKIITELKSIFENKVDVKTRAQLNATLHKMLNTENIIVYLIFTLVIIIALFNLIGALIMMVLDKRANLKTLYNLGTELIAIRRIFLFQGIILSVLSGFFGLLLGIIIVVIQEKFKIIMITESLPYPIVFKIQNILIVFGTIVSLGFFASLIASSRVTKKLLN